MKIKIGTPDTQTYPSSSAVRDGDKSGSPASVAVRFYQTGLSRSPDRCVGVRLPLGVFQGLIVSCVHLWFEFTAPRVFINFRKFKHILRFSYFSITISVNLYDNLCLSCKLGRVSPATANQIKPAIPTLFRCFFTGYQFCYTHLKGIGDFGKNFNTWSALLVVLQC